MIALLAWVLYFVGCALFMASAWRDHDVSLMRVLGVLSVLGTLYGCLIAWASRGS